MKALWRLGVVLALAVACWTACYGRPARPVATIEHRDIDGQRAAHTLWVQAWPWGAAHIRIGEWE